MRRRTVIPALAAAVLLLGACSGASGDDSADAAASPAAGGGNADFAAYQQCLSEHGVELQNGQGGFPGGGERPTGVPSGAPSGFPTDRPSGAPSDFPSGGPGQGNGRGMRVPDGVDEETWQAAQQACAALMPSRPNGGPGANASASPNAVFWQCMADHDVTAPESGDPDDLDASDATVKEARATCDALLPASS